MITGQPQGGFVFRKLSFVHVVFILISMLFFFIPVYASATDEITEGEPRISGGGNLLQTAGDGVLADGKPVSRIIYYYRASYTTDMTKAQVGRSGDVSMDLAKSDAGAVNKPVSPDMNAPSPTQRVMTEGEMLRVGTGHRLWLLRLADGLPQGQPVSRVIAGGSVALLKGMQNLDDETLEEVFAGRGNGPFVWTIKDTDLAVMAWAPLYERLVPLADENELWVPTHRSSIWRRYYDVTMERYGWELEPQDLKREWGQFYVTGVGLGGKRLTVDRVTVDDFKYRPAGLPPFRHSSEEPFTAINTGGRVSWIWRQAYYVHFDKYQVPLTRTWTGPSSPTGPGLIFDLSSVENLKTQ